jgi:hypothetical protein
VKFTCTIDINAPKTEIDAIFINSEKQKYFQDGFISKHLINGETNTIGAKSKITYKRLELIKTIQLNNLPDEFCALYEHKHTTNTMHVKFVALNRNKTTYISEIHYTNFKDFTVNMMAKLFPGMFKKQVEKWMVQFKD